MCNLWVTDTLLIEGEGRESQAKEPYSFGEKGDFNDGPETSSHLVSCSGR